MLPLVGLRLGEQSKTDEDGIVAYKQLVCSASDVLGLDSSDNLN